jgi:hypothetical protein
MASLFFTQLRGNYSKVREITIAAVLLASTSLENADGLVDTRLTYKEYAAQKLDGDFNELHRRFSASGYLTCGDGDQQSASVVARNDIVVGAAHSFREKINGKCVPAHCELSDSSFQVIKPNGSRGRKIRILQDTARVSQSWRCDDTQFDIDWAIARLQQPVTDVIPYEPAVYEPSKTGAISLNPPSTFNVTLLAAQSNNFRNASNAHPSPPTIADCLIGYIWNMSSGGQSLPASFGLGINCKSGPGSSGGAVMTRQLSSWVFIGAVSGSKYGSQWDHLPFSDKNYTGGPLLTVNSEFYKTLMNMSGRDEHGIWSSPQ